MIPNKIYLEKEKDTGKLHHLWGDQAVVSSFYEHIEYIRKDALLEWARKEADKSFNSFAREELGMEAREKGLAFERLIKHIESL